MVGDLPDYTKYVTPAPIPPPAEQGPLVPRPKGGVLEKGSLTTTDTYQTVASRTVTSGKQFQLAKILVSCDKDVMYKLRWSNADVSMEVYVPGTVPFPDWFPWDYVTMVGDGSKKFEVQVKYPAGGSAGTCHAEIVGEEV